MKTKIRKIEKQILEQEEIIKKEKEKLDELYGTKKDLVYKQPFDAKRWLSGKRIRAYYFNKDQLIIEFTDRRGLAIKIVDAQLDVRCSSLSSSWQSSPIELTTPPNGKNYPPPEEYHKQFG